ncbi:Chloramphenicol acetyltransferase-like domain superfamily [Sesbania bispinosa]|nr:Chloramphenicol acetyltransferase-like domain superfamily [Sesbania bispinosa]
MSVQTVEPKGRTVGGTECSWCRAIRGGTGIAVLALRTSKALPLDIPRLQNALHKLQNSHPILRSRLQYSNTEATFSFVTSPTPFVMIESHNLSTTSKILQRNGNDAVSPFQQILEHELNQNTWQDPTVAVSDMFVASIYALPDATWTVVMRLHVAACDRTTAVSLLRELLVLMKEEEAGKKEEVGLAIEDLLPGGKAKKPIWSRGIDMLSYSVNSLRLTNLKFNDTKSTRLSQVVRLQLNHIDTKRILDGCKGSKIKLCGALSAAGLMAAHSSKSSSKKYGIITLTDCRSTLQPPLSIHNFGFYHSAILNNHVVKGGESLWELAKRTYGAFANSKNNNKHFLDMADMNFLMCKAIDNPGLTSSSSLRTSIMSVFEDTVVDDGGEKQREVGVEDYMGCASVHGVGPSMAIFDTIRDGKLDCICVYPAPLHSREQMQDLVNKMKAILIEAGKTCKE